MTRQTITPGVLLTISCMSYSASSFAYLDPGTASIILQGAIAAVAGAAIAIKVYWHRIKSFFTKSTKKEPGKMVDETKSNSTSD